MGKAKRKNLEQPWFWLIVGGILATAAVVALLSFTTIAPSNIKTSSYTYSYTPRPATPTPVQSAAELLAECREECTRRYDDECMPGANMVVSACYAAVEAMFPEPENPFDENAKIQDGYRACSNLRQALNTGCNNSLNSCQRACENVI